jgi:hypothetical protein
MMNKEYVSVNDFHYKGYNIDGVGGGRNAIYNKGLDRARK